MKTRSLIGLGTFTFLVGLVVHAPAATVQAWLTPKDATPQLRLMGVAGTVMDGSANRILVNGQPVWGELEWHFKPLQLLLARLTYQLQGNTGETILLGDAALLPTGHLNLKPVLLSGSVKSLLTLLGQPYLPMDGQARLDAEKIVLKQNWPVSAQGKVEVQDLIWTLAREPVTLGDFQADVSTDAGVVTTRLQSLEGGPLELSGEVIAKPDRSYRAQIQFRVRGTASEELRSLLGSVGSPDAQGYYRLNREGKVP